MLSCRAGALRPGGSESPALCRRSTSSMEASPRCSLPMMMSRLAQGQGPRARQVSMGARSWAERGRGAVLTLPKVNPAEYLVGRGLRERTVPPRARRPGGSEGPSLLLCPIALAQLTLLRDFVSDDFTVFEAHLFTVFETHQILSESGIRPIQGVGLEIRPFPPSVSRGQNDPLRDPTSLCTVGEGCCASRAVES